MNVREEPTTVRMPHVPIQMAVTHVLAWQATFQSVVAKHIVKMLMNVPPPMACVTTTVQTSLAHTSARAAQAICCTRPGTSMVSSCYPQRTGLKPGTRSILTIPVSQDNAMPVKCLPSERVRP
ncbi:hypothetical protein DPMN_193855 [Dreissena polymorpha]|uniref:Uncharacterized protein n=1 Tax=Dreissena polymorpha TaxID=45954 RepID=A0A9D3Y4Y1_DREPO|nr:hypothetical protein DPMN_193855 [Dreissena polymorpha]